MFLKTKKSISHVNMLFKFCGGEFFVFFLQQVGESLVPQSSVNLGGSRLRPRSLRLGMIKAITPLRMPIMSV